MKINDFEKYKSIAIVASGSSHDWNTIHKEQV